MMMPEATVNEDNSLSAGKHEIRRAGQVFSVESIPKAQAMDETTNDQLGLSVAAANARHQCAPGLG